MVDLVATSNPARHHVNSIRNNRIPPTGTAQKRETQGEPQFYYSGKLPRYKNSLEEFGWSHSTHTFHNVSFRDLLHRLWSPLLELSPIHSRKKPKLKIISIKSHIQVDQKTILTLMWIKRPNHLLFDLLLPHFFKTFIYIMFFYNT